MFGVSLVMTGMRVFCLHQRTTISMYSGTWPTAAPMPRSLMPCGQPKLSSMPSAPVSSTSGRIAFQACSSQGTISETTSARSGQSFLTCLISCRLICSCAVGDQLDVVEAEQAAVGAPDRAVARAVDVDDRRPLLAERLPHHAAPARLEGADDIVGLVGRRRRGQPERVGRFDADEIVADVSHGLLWCGAAHRATRRDCHSIVDCCTTLALLERAMLSGRSSMTVVVVVRLRSSFAPHLWASRCADARLRSGMAHQAR